MAKPEPAALVTYVGSRLGACAALTAVAMALGGCETQNVAALQAGATATPSGTDRYGCPLTQASSDDQLPEAATEADTFGAQHPTLFTGVAVCRPENRIIVCRPEQGRSLDAEFTAIAARHRAGISFVSVEASKADLDRLQAQVLARRPELTARGVPWQSMGSDILDAVVKVGVKGDLDVAREVLADLGPRIWIEAGDAGGL